jgi:hypothetical protein
MAEYDPRPQRLLSAAVEKVCESNPRLVVMPYEQLKAAALELARQLLAARSEQMGSAD